MDNDSLPSNKARCWRWLLAVAGGLVLLAGLFYLEEDVRGWLAWHNCKHALEAKGGALEWDVFIPPPVPDELNFFKAPNMTAWFGKHDGQVTNELTEHLQHAATPMTIAEFVILPPTSNSNTASANADLVLRYSSFGSAVFVDSDAPVNPQSTAVELANVPITAAIKALARQAGISYSLDQKIRYNQPDGNGQVTPEPAVSVRWESIAARSALLALLNQYDLQLVEDAKSNRALITQKDSAAPPIYASTSTGQKLKTVLQTKLQDIINPNTIAAQGILLLTNPVSQIKPARIIFLSERPPADQEIIALMRQFFQNDAVQNNSLGMRVERSETHSLRVVVNAQSAAGYLAWSDRFAPVFDLIREALKRPYARMDGDYATPVGMPIPNFVAVRMVAQTLAQRAKSDLLLGRPDQALQEMKLLHALCRMLEAAPTGKPMTMVAAMINGALTGLYVTTVAEGIQSRAWQEPQLAALQNQLAEIDLPPCVMQAFREEPASACRLLETMPISKWANGTSVHPDKWSVKVQDWLLDWLWPHGWTYQNMVCMATLYHSYQQGFDPAHATISPHNFEAATRAVDDFVRHGRSPYKFLAAIAIPNFSRATQATAHNQTSANEAQIVCALERYHLVYSEYPETLEGLVPHFIATLPHDLIGGAPLIYRRSPPGNFLLYSVGWDSTDDGGLPVADWFAQKGDWVWKS